jgi:hypothetical protein
LLKVKIRNMESDTCVMTVKKDKMINLLVIYVSWMYRYDIQKDISKIHIWHEKLEKYINDLKG